MDRDHPQYLTEKQVSVQTGIALSTLRNWRWERKNIPYLRIGKRSVRYLRSDVEHFMESHRIETEDSR